MTGIARALRSSGRPTATTSAGIDLHNGRELKALATPTDRQLVEKLLWDAGYDSYEAGRSINYADRIFEAGLNAERRYFFEDLQWRAKRGEATSDDVRALVNEIRAQPPRFTFQRSQLITILGETRALEHEDFVAQYLYSWERTADAAAASHVLVTWGLLEKYESRLIELLRGVPEDHDGFLRYSLMSQMGDVLMKTCRPSIARAILEVAEAAPIGTPARTNGIHYLACFNGGDFEEAFQAGMDDSKHAAVMDRARARLNEPT